MYKTQLIAQPINESSIQPDHIDKSQKSKPKPDKKITSDVPNFVSECVSIGNASIHIGKIDPKKLMSSIINIGKV